MPLRIKRVTDPADPSDAARVLVDRLWPRGQRKARLKLDAWLKDIAPSADLRKWFDHQPEKWDGFRDRFKAELDANPEAIAALQDLLRKHGTVTLLFGSHEPRYNNAAALCEYMQRRMPRKRKRAS